ncbi:MAG: phenylalanine--tRNA ligase subunit beta, partial [Bacteroidales bacterium]|nr:phenylalanine--tRNA ligase subunit beta [Bacteroidales bacterium]
LPSGIRMSVNATEKPEPETVRNSISNFLAANGFVETMNNSLTKGDYYSKLSTFPEEKCVKIMNPLSSDLNVMRQTLLLNGLEVIAYNLNRQASTIRTFEYGSVYSFKPGCDGKTLESYSESQRFALFMSGPTEKVWRSEARKGSYFQLKGYLELLLRRYGMDLYTLETAAAPSDIFAEGLEYKMPGSQETLAVMGTVNQVLCRSFGIKQPVFAAEINWPAFFTMIKRNRIRYSELPKFPEVRRDLALLLDEGVQFSALRRSAIKAGKKLIRNVSLFDVYRGDKIAEGKKQYAISFTLQDLEKTLTDVDVEKIMSKILGTLSHEFGATLR